MLFSIAWRNAWRNGRRSSILVASLAVGLFAGLLMMALMRGMMLQQVESTIRSRTSHLQIQAKEFRAFHDIGNAIPNADRLLEELEAVPGLAATASRSVLELMASTAGMGRGLQVLGVDPAAEAGVTDIPQRMQSGSWFGEGRRNSIVVGQKLADRFGLRVGRKLVLTGQTPQGELTAGAFRVCGIFRSDHSAFDESTVFALGQDLDRIFDLGGLCHEIALVLDDMDRLPEVRGLLEQRHPDLDVLDWRELAPEVALGADSTEQMNQIFLIVIMTALVFGMTNTMLMSVIERRRELGMLRALGMRSFAIVRMILVETLLLAATGGMLGILAGFLGVALLKREGLDLGRFAAGMEEFGMSAVLVPELYLSDVPGLLGLVVLAALVASVWPALRVLRLQAVDALKP